MKFRVTSVADEESAGALRTATVKLEDWLNASLSDGQFGTGLDQFAIVVVSVDDDPFENERWTKAHNKMGRVKHPFTGESAKYLSVAVPVPPAAAVNSELGEFLALVSARAIETLSVRPKRIPTGVDYEHLSAAVTSALRAYT